jgi:mitochondrial enoyl-[acyl-carrier protein] reductase / trans-2-enoyl-CoA reductase
MKAARFSNFGTPTEVIQLVEEEEPGPLEPGEALLEVLATPIHPSDLATIAGFYGLLPKLPAVPGNEGVGRVLRVEGDGSVKPGDLVFLPMSNGGSWRERMKAKTQRLLPVPPGADLHQMAMVSANPPSAELLLREFGKPQPGEWVIQNAANSAVGRYLITLARREGIKTVNVVRRAGLADELKALGADVVLEDGPGLEQQIREATGGASIRLAFDAVGGSSTLRLGEALAMNGILVHYGAMSGKAPSVTPGALLFRNVSLRGFWFIHWLAAASREARVALMDKMAKLVADGTLHAPVDAAFPLENIQEALKRAMEGGRQGKVLLTPVKA